MSATTGKRPPITENCPTKLAQLMEQCWHPDPQERPSFASILQSHVLDEGTDSLPTSYSLLHVLTRKSL
jgi:hypothetical protein